MKTPSSAPIGVPDERSVGRIVDLVVRQVTAPVEAMHRAIVGPWLRLGGTRAASVGHAVISGVYGSVRLVGSVVGATVDVVGTGAGRTTDAIHAFANAVWDDEITRSGMSLRASSEVAAAFTEQTGRLVVLIHGLGQTERSWAPLVETLADTSLTPLLVRYDSGRAVADNAADLADLLGEIIASWPVPLEEVDLVGYSMGGLVGRKALDIGRTSGQAWAGSVRHLVTIAAPHLGSPIEKAVRLASVALRVAPQSRPLSEFIESRSSGIRDLGAVLDAPRSFDGVSQHVIAAVATADRSHPLGALVGDLVVRVPSASGEGRGFVVAADDVVVVGGRAHSSLLDDPAVHQHVMAWLDPGESAEL